MERRREAKAGVKATCPRVVLGERGDGGGDEGAWAGEGGGVEDVVGDGGGGRIGRRCGGGGWTFMEGKRGLVGVGRPSRYCVSVKCKSQRESEDLQTKRSGPECWVGREIGREREELGIAEPPARIDGIGNLGVDGGVMVRSGSATGLRYGALGG